MLVAVGEAVGVLVTVAVGEAVGVFVTVTVGVAVGVFVTVTVGEAVGVFVTVAVGVAVAVAAKADSPTAINWPAKNKIVKRNIYNFVSGDFCMLCPHVQINNGIILIRVSQHSDIVEFNYYFGEHKDLE